VRKVRTAILILLLTIVVLVVTSGQFLVVDTLQPADVIVVLAGETNHRPARGVQLLMQKYAPKMLLNVPDNEVIYDRNEVEIANSYIQTLPQRESVKICPITGLSTKAEAREVGRCLAHEGVHRILVVTSDYHTRRARSIFQHELPDYQMSVTPAYDPLEFGTRWWQHRQWAKTNFDEWLRLLWWEGIDRWR